MKIIKIQDDLKFPRELHGGKLPGLPPDATQWLMNAAKTEQGVEHSKARIDAIDFAAKMIRSRWPEYFWKTDKNGNNIDDKGARVEYYAWGK